MIQEEKLNQVITTFFEGLGYYNIKVKQAEDFAYYTNGLITYTLFDCAYFDLGFEKYIKTNYDIPPVSIFTLSLLHELGHYITFHKLNKKKYAKACKIKKRINTITCNSMEKAINVMIKYCSLYDEAIATKKAIQILKKNYSWVLLFEYHFKEALRNAAVDAAL